jgi:2-phospho-L-lactate/phosphoenolpyruvate guanylyltransferase
LLLSSEKKNFLLTWHAIIPLKSRGERKTRLAARLSEVERHALTETMFAHVAAVVRATPGITAITVLSDALPPGWDGALATDKGRGLNSELAELTEQLGGDPLLIIHADLPLLCEADVAAMLDAAQRGSAIAPDRHASGTNALALRYPTSFTFAFGPDSFARHRMAAGGDAQIVQRRGLAFDIDTPADLDAVRV